jgi:drug/metabolite transporter (DMT)-like permease
MLLIAGYSCCYFLALSHGITPGLLATVLGVQPILTLMAVERRFPPARLIGLALSMTGLVLIVYQSIGTTHLSVQGMLFALGSLASATTGAILQKRVTQAPAQVLPLQYGLSVLVCLALLLFQPFQVDFTPRFLVAWAWLGVVISVVAQLLFYRLIQGGSLVNVTSLFYLVPVVTATMDYVILGNRLPIPALGGMAAILLGLALVFRSGPVDRSQVPCQKGESRDEAEGLQ